MKCRQNMIGGRGPQLGRLVTGILGAALLAGCTGNTSTPDVAFAPPQNETVLVPQVDGTGGSPSTEQPVNGEVADPTGEIKYPPDNDGDDPAGMIVTGVDETGGSMAISPWLASIRLFRRESDPSNKGHVTVELTRYAEDFPISAHIEFFSEPLDSCMIRNRGIEEGVDRANPPPPAINGGEAVILNTPAGPWLSLERLLMSDQQLTYLAQDPLPGVLPEAATLSIPGGAFPTVAAYPLFEPEPVVRLLPDSLQPVTAESRFSWIPSYQSTHVKIDFMTRDEAGDFQRYPVSCWVRDDGSFELPTTVLEALEPLEMQDDSGMRLMVRYSRVYSRVDLLGGMVFHQRMEIAE